MDTPLIPNPFTISTPFLHLMAEILLDVKMTEDFLLLFSIDGGNSVGERKLREEILLGGDFCWDVGPG